MILSLKPLVEVVWDACDPMYFGVLMLINPDASPKKSLSLQDMMVDGDRTPMLSREPQ